MTIRKAVDWDQANPYDRDWQYLFKQLIVAHRRHVDAETVQVRFRHDLALCSISEIDYYKQLRQSLRNQQDKLFALLAPWSFEGSFEEVVMPTLKEAYSAHYGNLDDPEVAARIDAVAEFIERQNRGEI